MNSWFFEKKKSNSHQLAFHKSDDCISEMVVSNKVAQHEQQTASYIFEYDYVLYKHTGAHS